MTTTAALMVEMKRQRVADADEQVVAAQAALARAQVKLTVAKAQLAQAIAASLTTPDPRDGQIVADSLGIPHPFDAEHCDGACQPLATPAEPEQS